jgi:hypothetical protein
MPRVVVHYSFSECEHFEAGWDLEQVVKLFKPLEKPPSSNEGGSANGITGACTARSGSSVARWTSRIYAWTTPRWWTTWGAL